MEQKRSPGEHTIFQDMTAIATVSAGTGSADVLACHRLDAGHAGVSGGAPGPPAPGLRGMLAGLNHNVLLTAIAKGLSGIASGIWAMSTIATYLFMIEDNSNTVRTPRHKLLRRLRVSVVMLSQHPMQLHRK